MLRSSALSLVVAVVAVTLSIGCGSVSEEDLFGPPIPGTWSGGQPSTGGATASGGGGGGGSGGFTASGGTGAGGIVRTGGANAGGASSGGYPPTGGTGGLDPSTGGSSGEIGSPGVISCAGLPCRSDMSPVNTCCLGGFQGTTCEPEIVACAFYGAHAFHCDDAADCGGGAICCAVSTAGLISADCLTECTTTSTSVQLCRTHGECPEGRECAPSDELPDYNICQ
jgi:hypothetical protein